ncbi:MAG TPA: patatin-like phospholipase family protein [Pyrinomonadaceae bacterium]
MPEHVDIPLHLYQVLEEEYLSLHGELSPSETVRLGERDRDVVAELDWNFHTGHVREPRRLVNRLTPCGDALRDDLATHLRKAAPRFREAFDRRGDDAGLVDALNELLRVWIYHPDAFKYVALTDTLRVLLDTRPCDGTPELAHVNRLLLEQTFPDELEKASDIRLAAMYARIHRHPKGQAALSLSGGGIRSGTFALGLLQGLARFGLLREFDYLSTVSGGGYIGGWLTAWLHRHRNELDGVTNDLSTVGPKSKVDPDPPAISYLREYSNFLTPKAGLLTADTWAFLAIYLRNLLLNWLVLIPLLLALLALPRLNVALLLSRTSVSDMLRFPGRYLFLGAGSLLLTLALTYVIVSRPAVSAKIIERSRFWRGRLDQRSFLAWCLLPMVASAFCLTTYWARSSEARPEAVADKGPWFILFGTGVTVMAWVVASFSLERFTHPREFGKLETTELVILTLVGAGGGGLLYLASRYGSKLLDAPLGWWVKEWYACLAVPLMLLVVLLATTLFVGLTSKGIFGWAELLNDEDREWWARFNAWLLIAMLAWAGFSVLSLHGPRLLFLAPGWISSVAGASGAASLLAGFSAKTPANEEQAKARGGLLKTFVGEQLLPLLALVFLLVFLVALSLLTSAIMAGAAAALAPLAVWLGEYLPAGLLRLSAAVVPPFRDGFDGAYAAPGGDWHMRVVHNARFFYDLLFIVATATVSFALANRINLNKFSLHAGYRNRLIRGFLGASRDRGLRRPNPFTGFDPEDNLQMHELRPVLFHEGDFIDLESLAVKLGKAPDFKGPSPEIAPQDEVPPTLSSLLKSWLKPDTRDELKSFTGATHLPPRLRMNLIADLNSILESGLIQPASAPDGKTTLRKIRKEEEERPPDDNTILSKRAVLCAAYPDEIRVKYPPSHRLLHVVNTALNLVGGKKLAWQQRKAEPFAVTPLHAGSFRVGYRRSRHYGGYRGISLGTAVAISGAAASSNMGYYTTSPVLSMVLTLFNVRLGWWLGNPGPAGQKTYRREAPRVSLQPVIGEALGLTDDTNPYVYLTDGGHFENLALYEMVLRRCRLIVLSDAAEDSRFQFNDLGNAVRKVRIDLGVPIDFDEVRIFKAKPGPEEPRAAEYNYWAFGRIRYSAVDKVATVDGDGQTVFTEAPDGVLIYVKPTVYGDAEPRDVLQYKKAYEEFPHQSTGDQFFDEPQFESYRMLGWHIMNLICNNRFDTSGGGDEPPRPKYSLNKAEFVEAALNNYKGHEQAWLKDLLEPDKRWLDEPEETKSEEPDGPPSG